jgi:predicted GNAT superfamily acetyltransferase
MLEGMVSQAIFTPSTFEAVAVEARRLADEACADAGIRMIEAHDATASGRLSDVLDHIWSRTGSPMMDSGLLVALAHAGNYEAIAEDANGNPVGGTVGFCGPAGMPFHSHIVGVLPGRVGRGAGRAIKLVQRAWCLERGIDTMTWTYDPLIARNAYFNLRRLGASAVEYLPDFYGTMTDTINAGQHSDRILMRWDLTATPPIPGALGPDTVEALPVVAEVDGAPTTFEPPADATRPVSVALPADIEGLRRTDNDLARRWRLETRRALGELLRDDWVVTGFVRPGATGPAYVLERRDAE